MPPVHSRLQREVLRLYRDLLRAASSKSPNTETPTVTRNPQLYKSIQKEFRRQASLYKKTDILQIEAAVRRGRRRLEDLRSGTVDRVSHLQLDTVEETGLVGAFAYGSVAFPQHGRSLSNSQLDLILIVRDPLSWHFNNIKRNPLHYSSLIRQSSKANEPPFYLKAIISGCPGPQVYYNPLIDWHDEVLEQTLSLKYGVVSVCNVIQDLLTWSHLYIAGRLHKPVLWIPLDNKQSSSSSSSQNNSLTCLRRAQDRNLLAALSYILLRLPVHTSQYLTEFELFHAISSISYDGDWRMIVGEDKIKVTRLVSGVDRLTRFRQLFADTFTHPSLSEFINFSPVQTKSESTYRLYLRSLNSEQFVIKLLNNIPERICANAVHGLTRNHLTCKSVLARLDPAQRQERLRQVVTSTVRRSSLQQTGLGLFTAGPWRSMVYAGAKLRKMFSSWGLFSWK
ncbi:Phosphatidate cytidylyltransferase mitochondrial [Paragonimus heterotremus]|uniref:Phosphatidate cytidylyltransferase, mitochondrial n=1 Tax=Paragonimus heterotremus TaxID=100268 RepID=A0A8J4TJC6_9TREM|nr:Phosphatidate cytidylyltransferase mitochondrial [Paragonimus heterotremus]